MKRRGRQQQKKSEKRNNHQQQQRFEEEKKYDAGMKIIALIYILFQNQLPYVFLKTNAPCDDLEHAYTLRVL